MSQVHQTAVRNYAVPSSAGVRLFRFRHKAWVALLSLCLGVQASAVVFHHTGDPSHNTNAPSGTLSGSGWDVTGNLGNFLGVAIGTNAVLSAWHLRSGNHIKDSTLFVYEGQSFQRLSHTNDPSSDLMVWRVQGTFTNYARLYVDQDEVGRYLVVHGRGRDRGAVVTTGAITNGWKEGAANYTCRWGANVVSETVDFMSSADGVLLRASFDADGIPEEGMLSRGDSGGGIFIRKGSEWRLAGINYSIYPAYFKQGKDGTRFLGTMIDYRGLYVDVYGNEQTWVHVPLEGPISPASFYATRVSRRLDWLLSVVPELDLPPPTSPASLMTIR